jgi:adenylate cyclase
MPVADSPAARRHERPMNAASRRRLAAVMIADVAGYSRLMERDEAGTHGRLLQIRAEVTDPAVLRHGGRIVRTAGDGILVEFPSAMSALQAAIEIQRQMAERNRGLSAERRIDHRIGINLGDILVDEHDIAGNGVNVAARLEAIAPPGGIAISATVRDQVRQDLGVRFVDAGAQQVKNIARPIRVFRVELDGRPARWRLRPRHWRPWLVGAAVLAAAVAGGRLAVDAFLPRTMPAQSLVVLPFAAAPDLPDGDALAASLTAQLTTAVSRVAGLTVIAPAVATRLAAGGADLKRIGSELNVRYAVDGRIHRSGERLRVAAHLVDTTSGASMGAEEVEAPLGPGEAPPAIVGRLADTLRARLRAAELRRVGAADSAYALTLRGDDEFAKAIDLEQVRQARSLFERALKLEPDHVPALVGRAHALAYEAHRIDAGAQREALLASADEVSLRAVTLEPGDAEAWGARANVLFVRAGLDAAAAAVEHGIRLNPYLNVLHSLSGQILLAQGRGEEALRAFDRGLALNPSSGAAGTLLHFRGRAYLLLGRYDAAVEACERGMAYGPEWPDYMLLAAAHALAGDPQRAAAARTELLRLQPNFSIGWHRAVAGRSIGGALTPFDEKLYDGLRRAGVPE